MWNVSTDKWIDTHMHRYIKLLIKFNDCESNQKFFFMKWYIIGILVYQNKAFKKRFSLSSYHSKKAGYVYFIQKYERNNFFLYQNLSSYENYISQILGRIESSNSGCKRISIIWLLCFKENFTISWSLTKANLKLNFTTAFFPFFSHIRIVVGDQRYW